MKSIIIDFDTDGNSKTEGKGFKGKDCDEKMRDFERELGTVKSRKNSPEYLQSTTTTVQQKAGGS